MKRIFPVVILALLLFLCSSCEEIPYPEEAVNAAFVVGITSNNTQFNTAIHEVAMLPAAAGSVYSFILADGSPAEVCSGTIPDLSERNYSKDMLTRALSGIQADIASQITGASPDSDEVDLATAIQAAGRALQANRLDGRENLLVIYSNCISTTGLINLVETPISKLDLDISVQSILDSMKGVVDLNGVQVIIYACGDVAEPQQMLSSHERGLLKEFYKKILLGLDADSVEFRDDLPLSTAYEFPQKVSCMATEGLGSALKEITVITPDTFSADAEPSTSPFLDRVFAIPETMVAFQGDSPQFLDPSAAEAALQPIAQYLLKHTDLRVLLLGSCAGDEETEFTLELSTSRAQTVRSALISQGVPEDRVIAIGLRLKDNPWHEYGVGYGEEGAVNRVTILLDASSEMAQQILTNSQ